MVNSIREQFPILKQKVYGKPLVYFDNAATTQKPQRVIDVYQKLNTEVNANIHRGLHYMSDLCTTLYEEARETVRDFINAGESHEIIFTSGTTFGINLVAFSYGEKFVEEGDEIIVSEMEHHSNIVPWQMLCEKKKATLRVLPFTERGELEINQLAALCNTKTKLLAITHASNMLGTINNLQQIISIAHQHNVPVLVDGAQYISHDRVDVQTLDCDFYVFSGHKLFAPTGIGILYAKSSWLNKMPPYQGGGDMVNKVSFKGTTYAEPPLKFESGTTNYQAAIALGEAIKFYVELPKEIKLHKAKLFKFLTNELANIDGVTIYGTAQNKVNLASFTVEGIHGMDIAQVMDKMGVALRSGTLCTQPILDHYDIPSIVRASLSIYNTEEEVSIFLEGLKKCIKILR